MHLTVYFVTARRVKEQEAHPKWAASEEAQLTSPMYLPVSSRHQLHNVLSSRSPVVAGSRNSSSAAAFLPSERPQVPLTHSIPVAPSSCPVRASAGDAGGGGAGGGLVRYPMALLFFSTILLSDERSDQFKNSCSAGSPPSRVE
jgi:hypothetical protein